MDFEHFALARDFFYLAALLFGAGLGCILNRFRRVSTARFRNVTVTAGFFFFSGSVAVLTLAVIHSSWMIFKEPSLYYAAGILAALVALAVRFPRASGFPLIFISGVFVVWMGFAILRFPVVDDLNLGRVTRDGSDLVLVRLFSPSGKESDTVLSYQSKTGTIEFRTFGFSLPGAFPLVKGEKRGFIAEIRNSEESYMDPRIGNFFSPGCLWPGADDKLQETWKQIFSFHETLERLETKAILPGAGLAIFFDGTVLSFR